MFLEEIEEKRRSRLKIIEEHVKNGVVFDDEFTAYIDCGVTIGAGTHIGPCVTLKGDTSIGKSCVIGQNTVIEDSNIEDDVEIKSSVITQSTVGSGTKVGPFAYMRPAAMWAGTAR